MFNKVHSFINSVMQRIFFLLRKACKHFIVLFILQCYFRRVMPLLCKCTSQQSFQLLTRLSQQYQQRQRQLRARNNFGKSFALVYIPYTLTKFKHKLTLRRWTQNEMTPKKNPATKHNGKNGECRVEKLKKIVAAVIRELLIRAALSLSLG